MPQSNFNIKHSLQLALTAVKRWIEEVTLTDIPDKKIMRQLQDGTLLCELLCHIKSGLITRLNINGTEEAWLENVQNFLNGCQQLGLEPWQLFSSQEIVQLAENEQYNYYDDRAKSRLQHFLSTIYYLGLNATQQRDFTGPYLDLAVMKNTVIDIHSLDNIDPGYPDWDLPIRQRNNYVNDRKLNNQHQSSNGSPYYNNTVSPIDVPSDMKGSEKFHSDENHEDLIVLKLRGIPQNKLNFGFTVTEEFTTVGRALIIDSVSIGSRAEAEGLQVKDEIVWINGDDIMAKSLETIHDKISEGISNGNLMLKIHRYKVMPDKRDCSDTESMVSSVGDKLSFPEDSPAWNNVVKEAEEYNRELLYNGEDRHSTYSLNESEDGDAISDLETLSTHSINKLSSPKIDSRSRGFSIGLKPLKDDTDTSDYDDTNISPDEKRRSSPIDEENPYRRSVPIPTNPRTIRKNDDKIDKAKDITKPRNMSHTVRSLSRSNHEDTVQPLKHDGTLERNSQSSVAKDSTETKPLSPNSESDVPNKDSDQPRQKKESTNALVSTRRSSDVLIQPKRRTASSIRDTSPIVNQGVPNQTNRKIPLRMRGTSPATVNHDERSPAKIQTNKTPVRANTDKSSTKISSTAVVRNSPTRSSTSSEPTTVQAPRRNQRNVEKISRNTPSPVPVRPLRTAQSQMPPRSNLPSKKVTPAPSTNQNRGTNEPSVNIVSSSKSSAIIPQSRKIRPSLGRQSPVVKSADNELITPSQRNMNKSPSQVYPPNPLRNAIPPRRNIQNQSTAANSNLGNQQFGRNQRNVTSAKGLPVRATPMNQNPAADYDHSFTPPPSRNLNNIDQKDPPNVPKNNAPSGGYQNPSPQSMYPPNRSSSTHHPVNRNPITPTRHILNQNPANARKPDRNLNAPLQSFDNISDPSRPGPRHPVNVNKNLGPTPPTRRQLAANSEFRKLVKNGYIPYGNSFDSNQRSPVNKSQNFNNWSSV